MESANVLSCCAPTSWRPPRVASVCGDAVGATAVVLQGRSALLCCDTVELPHYTVLLRVSVQHRSTAHNGSLPERRLARLSLEEASGPLRRFRVCVSRARAAHRLRALMRVCACVCVFAMSSRGGAVERAERDPTPDMLRLSTE